MRKKTTTRFRSKRFAKKTDGKRSGFEARVDRELRAQGITADYEPFSIPYTLEKKYVPDFQLPNKIILEVKGYFPSEDRTKMRRVKEQHPDLDIRIVLARPKTRIAKKSKTTYAMWCERHGFPWAEGSVPADWLTE